MMGLIDVASRINTVELTLNVSPGNTSIVRVGITCQDSIVPRHGCDISNVERSTSADGRSENLACTDVAVGYCTILSDILLVLC